MSTEQWKQITGYNSKHQISSEGRVKNRYGKSRTPFTDKDGYLTIGLNLNGKIVHRFVHRLVAIHFIENPDNKPTVNHKNGNRSDNRVENLEWATHSENSLHGFRSNGRVRQGVFLTEKEVVEIKGLLVKGKSSAILAKRYGVSRTTIYSIKTKRRWKHVA